MPVVPGRGCTRLILERPRPHRIDESVGRAQRASQGKVGTLRVGFIEMAMRHGVLSRAVMLFRARMLLRACMDTTWFQRAAS